jgi:hypothetical protein
LILVHLDTPLVLLKVAGAEWPCHERTPYCAERLRAVVVTRDVA